MSSTTRSDGASARNPRGARFVARLSRRFATERLQQSAKSLAAANITDPDRLGRIAICWRLNYGLIVQRLMRSILVVVRGEFATKMVQVFGAKDYEMVEAIKIVTQQFPNPSAPDRQVELHLSGRL